MFCTIPVYIRNVNILILWYLRGVLEPIPCGYWETTLHKWNHSLRQTSGGWALVSGLHMIQIRRTLDDWNGFTKKSIQRHSQWSNPRITEMFKSWDSVLGSKASRKSRRLTKLWLLPEGCVLWNYCCFFSFLVADLTNSCLKNCKPLSIPYGIKSKILKKAS